MRLGGGGAGGPPDLGQDRRRQAQDRGFDEAFEAIPCFENPVVWGCALFSLLVLAWIAMVSLAPVPPLFYAIRYNQFSKSADTAQIYEPGRYFIGPFNRFLLFPSSIQTIEFTNEPRLPISGMRYESLHSRTKEGLGLHFQVSLQYRLVPEHVGQLYQEFNQNYEQVFISSVRDVLIKAASEYEAAQFWEDRRSFGNEMQSMINQALAKTYAECWGLQLMVIDLPNQFEESIVATQVQKQQVLMREQEQVSTRIDAETTVIKAEYDRKVKILLAGGHANYTVITKEAQALARQRVIDVEANVIKTVRSSLGFTPSGLVDYQKYGAMDMLENSSLFFGFSEANSQVLLGGGQPASSGGLR